MQLCCAYHAGDLAGRSSLRKLFENAGKARLRKPTPDDGFALNQLVATSPPLDPNSIYCNLLQCTHFSDTAIAAEANGELVGFVSGYIPPNKPTTLFVWQIVIAKTMRGQGLAKQMLAQLLRNLQPVPLSETGERTTPLPLTLSTTDDLPRGPATALPR